MYQEKTDTLVIKTNLSATFRTNIEMTLEQVVTVFNNAKLLYHSQPITRSIRVAVKYPLLSNF